MGIDPGTSQSTYVVWNGSKVMCHDEVANEELLAIIARNPRRIMACEMIQSFGMNVGQECFETVYWVGRFAQDQLSRGGEFHRIFRMQIKMHLCHNSRAKDANIRQALIDRFGAPGTKKSPGMLYGISKHAWSALAVAVTFMEQKQ